MDCIRKEKYYILHAIQLDLYDSALRFYFIFLKKLKCNDKDYLHQLRQSTPWTFKAMQKINLYKREAQYYLQKRNKQL